MQLLLKFWRELIIIVLFFGWVITSLWLSNGIKTVENERDQYKSGLDFQNATLLNDAQKYEEKLKQLPKEIVKIKTKYEVIYAGIDDFKRDENETDCNASYRLLSTNNY